MMVLIRNKLHIRAVKTAIMVNFNQKSKQITEILSLNYLVLIISDWLSICRLSNRVGVNDM